MSHQMSIVHHFVPLNVQVLEKNFLRKSCSIRENKHKTTLKTFITYKKRSIVSILLKEKLFHYNICSHNICMSHQRSILHPFFPLNVQVLEKNFLRKSCSISKNKHKTTLKNINFAHITYV